MKTTAFTRPTLCALFCASALVSLLGCAAKPQVLPIPGTTSSGTASAPSSTSGAASISASSAAVSESARLPLENYDYIIAELKNYRAIGAQPLTTHENAYALAEAIYRYRDYHNSLLFDTAFDDITLADPALLVEIAASQAPHIDIYGDVFSKASTRNPIRSFYETQRTNGTDISLLSYGDDVRRTARSLFGDNYDLPRQEGRSIRYDESLDLYYLGGEGATFSTDYPILTNVEEKDDGSVAVETVRLCYSDIYNMWSTPDSSWESGDNADLAAVRAFISEKLASLPRYRYTLTPMENGWRVVAFAPL